MGGVEGPRRRDASAPLLLVGQEVFGWLAAIGELKRADPGLVVVPGHDFEWLRDTANAAGKMIFSEAPPSLSLACILMGCKPFW